MGEPVRGMVFKIARYTIHDGPGIRTTVFLKGCPARCLWCCNPESQSFQSDICWSDYLCCSCGRCASVCSTGAVLRAASIMRGVDRDLCTLCGACVEACPKDALEICGEAFTAEELFAKTGRDAPFWRRSGGGVTLSGGEVMAQPEFVKEFLTLCSKKFVKTAIETCLFAQPQTAREIADMTDHIIFDIKAIDADLHMQLTSVGNENILENAEYILKNKKSVLVRTPLVPDCNDSDENIDDIGAFLSRNRPGASIEILPYHGMGMGRYDALGREYALAETRPPDRDRMERAAHILGRYPLNVIYKI